MPDRTALLSEYLAGPALIEQCVANCSEEELEQRETPANGRYGRLFTTLPTLKSATRCGCG